MKIPSLILALAAAGFLGRSAFADDNAQPFALAMTQDGHGHQRFQYYQTMGDPSTSVALDTNSGGGVNTPLGTQRAQSDLGDTRLVVGTNQHAQATVADIPVTSHFSQAGQ